FTSNKDRNILSAISLDEVLITDYKTLSPDDGLEKVVDYISRYKQDYLPVLDAENKLVGVVELDHIRDVVLNAFRVKYTKESEIIDKHDSFILLHDKFYNMLAMLEQSQKALLRIIKDGINYGFVSKIAILKK